MLAQFVLYDGFDPLDVIAPLEVLTAGGIRAGLVSAEGAREVPAGLGLPSLRAAAAFDPGRGGLVVVPGAAGRIPAADGDGEDGDGEDGDTVPAVLARALRTGLPPLLRTALERPDVTVATVCGGSLLLAMAGLIGGRPVTGHHLGTAGLRAAGATVVDARVVDDGDLVSSAGVTSGLDLALHLLERESGPRVAHFVERLLAHERRGVVWRAEGPVLAGPAGA
ncbi:DJ-1/PfpI family protein [Streptomyces sp. NPDC006207]|nr:DJ-1/PfpI family protein [Streptomyces sp. PA03-5A]